MEKGGGGEMNGSNTYKYFSLHRLGSVIIFVATYITGNSIFRNCGGGFFGSVKDLEMGT